MVRKFEKYRRPRQPLSGTGGRRRRSRCQAAAIAESLRPYVTGKTRADLTSDAWLAPIRRLIEIAAAAA